MEITKDFRSRVENPVEDLVNRENLKFLFRQRGELGLNCRRRKKKTPK